MTFCSVCYAGDWAFRVYHILGGRSFSCLDPFLILACVIVNLHASENCMGSFSEGAKL